jgi:large conductance mechanosensitive channel
MAILKEFKEFIGSGSALDLAVGVIIGGAMTTILKSFVDELIVPLTGLLGKADFANSYLVLKGTVTDGLPLAEARKVAGAVVLGYGQFFTVALNTLILAFVVFLCVRAINRLRQKKAAEEPAGRPPTELLLIEIRDLIAKGTVS